MGLICWSSLAQRDVLTNDAYTAQRVFFAGLKFRGGRFGCITVVIRGLNFRATLVPRKINPSAKLKTDLGMAAVLLEPI